jgi:hypothetical protein
MERSKGVPVTAHPDASGEPGEKDRVIAADLYDGMGVKYRVEIIDDIARALAAARADGTPLSRAAVAFVEELEAHHATDSGDGFCLECSGARNAYLALRSRPQQGDSKAGEST